MSKGYMVVYDYKGHELSVGNPIVFPVRELAEKYSRNYEKKPWFNHETYIVEREYTRHDLEPCRKYNGKPVYNESWNFGIDAMEIGDYVEEDLVDYYIYCLPPACMRKDCSQLGEPVTDRYDETMKKWRATFYTWKYIADGVWEYCGDCFRGENVRRGEEITYV